MKRNWIWLMAVILMACSSNQVKDSSAELYHTEYPLEADIALPAEMIADQEIEVEILLTKNGQPIEDLEDVQIRIWQDKHGGQTKETIVPYNQEGWYRTNIVLDDDGIYYLQLHASLKNSSIMPTKRFIVGELSSKELEQLERSKTNEPKDHQHGEHH
ncbi:FixH family protein [Gracilibacillus xinjiangensis]|uniref:FixH family protein n=1 Tax=Gracilibacillus xinjiangensis TaxID=1193282 RepID=A0ABV8WV36_9BACI